MNYNKRANFEELSNILFTMKSQAERLEAMVREETNRDVKTRLVKLHEIADDAYVQSIKALLNIQQNEPVECF